MRDRTAAAVVEAAYRWAPDDASWLDGIAQAASKLDVGGGVITYVVEPGKKSRVTAISAPGVSDADVAAVKALTASFSPRLSRAMHAPTEFAGNAAYRFERLAVAFGTTRSELEARAGHQLPSMWALMGGDPRERVISLGFLGQESIDPNTPYPQRHMARRLGLIGAHLAAALRLRTSLGPITAEDPMTEAVLTPSGKILDATGAATVERRALAAAVARSERARLRSTSDEEALRLWRALVSGRWSIVDIEERDGKRLLLARRNTIGGAHDITALAELERSVVWLAAMGHSLKYMAYELGVSVQTVSRRLSNALATLGVSSRRELVRLFSSRES